MPAVAINVDNRVAAELMTEFQGDLCHFHDRDRILAIHVKDRRVDHLRDLGAILTRTGVRRQCRKADLVVDHEVDRAAGGIARQLGHIEDLGDHALAYEGRIAVDQNWNHFLAIGGVLEQTLARAGFALDDGIHRFKVAGICREVDLHFVTGRRLAHVAIAEVVLHIAVAAHGIRREVALKFVENDVKRLVKNIRENVQTPAMGHSHDELLDSALLAVLDDGIESED